MISTQVGAYQTAAYAFSTQNNSGTQQARADAAREAPAFPQTNFGVDTRSAVTLASSAGGASGQALARPSNDEGRGKIVDLFA